MKYILEYDKKNNIQNYILENENYETYEDSNWKHILLDDSLMVEIPFSNEFNEFMVKQASSGKPILDTYGNKTNNFYTIINLFKESAEYKNIRKKELLNLLSDSDWKVTVNYELIAAGLPPKYDPSVLHKNRQSWRDEINELEREGL